MTDAATVREALSREHRAGGVLPDRGDGLHWLACIDCGTEWAEKDDGSYGGGELQCEHAALAALDRLVAERDEARTELLFVGGINKALLPYQERAVSAEARVAELEQALREIADRGCHNAPRCANLPPDSWHCAACIARAALGGTA